mmetsp:Transcript_6324/g.13726  ORF Transcript_6324/g.13726 Transcript_6324/m.13726 type:complete len:246 (-) Transcript_6324:654-1391(-)
MPSAQLSEGLAIVIDEDAGVGVDEGGLEVESHLGEGEAGGVDVAEGDFPFGGGGVALEEEGGLGEVESVGGTEDSVVGVDVGALVVVGVGVRIFGAVTNDELIDAISGQNVRLGGVGVGSIAFVDRQVEGPFRDVVPFAIAPAVFEAVEHGGDGGDGAVSLVDLRVESAGVEEEVVRGVLGQVGGGRGGRGRGWGVQEGEGRGVGVVEEVGDWVGGQGGRRAGRRCARAGRSQGDAESGGLRRCR